MAERPLQTPGAAGRRTGGLAALPNRTPMNRRPVLALLPLVLFCGCKGFSLGVIVPLPPRAPRSPEPEVIVVSPVPEAYRHLPQRTSFRAMSSTELETGCYVGDFVLGNSQLRITGAGLEETVIHGNLVLQTQCKVSHLTVTGDVIFEGHQAELDDVDFYGRIVDQGSQNRY